jgi:biopolymer transport protein ExbD
MLDIIFILLVFFILTAGSVFQSLDLKLPSSVTKEIPVLDAPKHIMLEIRENNYAIDGYVMPDFSALQTHIPIIVKEKPEHELVIAGDKKVAIERLLQVLTYLQSEGIEAANILMQNEEQQ